MARASSDAVTAAGIGGGDRDPVWSPDGRLVAYAHGIGTADIYTVKADGSGGERNLTDTPDADGRFPSWRA